MDRAYLRLLPDFSAPFRRGAQIRGLLRELSFNPANAKAAMDLGILYFESKRYNKALECLKRASERIDDSARLYLYMGMSYFETGDEARGFTLLNKALELDRGVSYGLPYIYLFRYELSEGENPENLSALEESFERFANTENFNRMGKVYKKYNNKIKAREMFESSLNSYSYCPKSIRRLHRKWALSSWFNKMLL